MLPAPNDTDWQVAKFQHREAMARGQRQQFEARMCEPSANTRSASAAIRQHLGTFLVGIGQRLRQTYAVETQGMGSRAANERAGA